MLAPRKTESQKPPTKAENKGNKKRDIQRHGDTTYTEKMNLNLRLVAYGEHGCTRGQNEHNQDIYPV
jgi:hypothetical protein